MEKNEIKVAQQALGIGTVDFVNGLMDACRIQNFQFSIFEMYFNKVKIKI